MSPPATIDLDDLGLDQGGHLLLKWALMDLPAGAQLKVRGGAPELAVHLRAWCRHHGHGFFSGSTTSTVVNSEKNAVAGIVTRG
ncbi:MAG: hypothetical protein M3159_03130, partial [Actinomycetota bacterium]|nr:hypothetical protein [Actinomycetota bacterium]